MFYRENGQFKTSYRADQQIFAITQDRVGILLLIAFAFWVCHCLPMSICFAQFWCLF